MKIIYIIIIIFVVLYFLYLIISTLVKYLFYQKIVKDTKKVIKQSQEQFQFWLKKLDSESKELKKSTDILQREYREYLEKKKKDKNK